MQFASEAAIQKAGVCLGTVQERPMRTRVKVQSEAEYDRTHFVQLSLPVSGRVWRVDAEVGQTVRKGQVVALIDSVEVGKAKAELLEQLAELHLKTKSQERIQDLKNLESKARLEETAAAAQVARIRVFNARQTLRNWGLTVDDLTSGDTLDEKQIRFLGLPPEVVETLDAGSTTANLIPVTSPIDGTIISRDAIGGEMVAASKTLFTIANVERMWVISDVPQSEMDHITVGQPIAFTPDGERERTWKGRISWISTEIDDQTRTVRARAEVENADGKLRAHTFGTTEILIRDNPKAIVVPSDAIQWEGCCHIVFVRLADEIFGVRKVQPGTSDRFFTEITVGVLPGEVIATAGSHVLTSEILKSALGAGCCGE